MLPKVRISLRTPYVGLYGFLNGYEVHRTIYSCLRIKKLLGLPADQQIRFTPSYQLSWDVVTPAIPTPYVCVAVGAEWDFRRYDYWGEVIRGIPADLAIVLIGSGNGAAEADTIKRTCPRTINYVGKYTLIKTVKIIEGASYLLAADGGLWHIGAALAKPSVALFADCQLFDRNGAAVTRSTPDISAVTLSAKEKVSEIDPKAILEAFRVLRERYESSPIVHKRNMLVRKRLNWPQINKKI
jgi:ADP-heptose:LPS heptosyltransferase